MILLYQGPGALITDEVFEALTPTRNTFRIKELRYIHVVRGRPAEIRALHNGRLVVLFLTRDRLEFGQVERALLRALERLEDAS